MDEEDNGGYWICTGTGTGSLGVLKRMAQQHGTVCRKIQTTGSKGHTEEWHYTVKWHCQVPGRKKITKGNYTTRWRCLQVKRELLKDITTSIWYCNLQYTGITVHTGKVTLLQSPFYYCQLDRNQLQKMFTF